MARFRAGDEDKYGGQGGGGYFSLKDDGDTARVRFMYNSINDVEGYAVHEVEIEGKKRYVNCPREYNDPIDVCPFCREKRYQVVKLFIPIYDIETGNTKVWERGKKYFSKMSSLCSRYASDKNLVSTIFEIERNGKAGDTQTTYEIYSIKSDDTRMEDLPEMPNILGGIVLDKSAEDMEFYLEQGEFPPEDGAERPQRRAQRDERPARRTPATNRDRF